MENTVVTVIDESATVESAKDLAHFSMSFKYKDDTLEGAKALVSKKIPEAFKLLDSFKASGVKFDGEINSQVYDYKLEHVEGNERMLVGYQSINVISFTVFIDDKVDHIYAQCYKLDPNMSSPVFSIKDAVSLYEQALEKVSKNVKDKLEKECALMGVNPNQLKIQNWNFGYEGFIRDLNVNAMQNYFSNSGVRGATGITGPVASPAFTSGAKIGSTYQRLLGQKLDPGKHSVTVAVRVNYVWA